MNRLPAQASPDIRPVSPGIRQYFRGFPGVSAQGVAKEYPASTEEKWANLKRIPCPAYVKIGSKQKNPPESLAIQKKAVPLHSREEFRAY